MVRVQDAKSDCSHRGKAEVRILDFKTAWSEFQQPCQTAATRGEAELCILDFKTTWSEFKKPSQTATERGEANSIAPNVVIDLSSCVCQHILDLPPNWSPRVVSYIIFINS